MTTPLPMSQIQCPAAQRYATEQDRADRAKKERQVSKPEPVAFSFFGVVVAFMMGTAFGFLILGGIAEIGRG